MENDKKGMAIFKRNKNKKTELKIRICNQKLIE